MVYQVCQTTYSVCTHTVYKPYKSCSAAQAQESSYTYCSISSVSLSTPTFRLMHTRECHTQIIGTCSSNVELEGHRPEGFSTVPMCGTSVTRVCISCCINCCINSYCATMELCKLLLCHSDTARNTVSTHQQWL